MSIIKQSEAQEAMIGIFKHGISLTLQALKTRGGRNFGLSSVSENIKHTIIIRNKLVRCIDKLIDWSIKL